MMCCYHSMPLLMWDTTKTMLVLSQNKPLPVWLYICVLCSYWDCISVHVHGIPIHISVAACFRSPSPRYTHSRFLVLFAMYFCCRMKDVLFPATSYSNIILVLCTNAWVHILICESKNQQQAICGQVLVTSMPLECWESHSARRLAIVPVFGSHLQYPQNCLESNRVQIV